MKNNQHSSLHFKQIVFIFGHVVLIGPVMTNSKYRNRIRVALADKQATNRWLAEKMGVTDMTVSRWRTNKVQPSMAQLVEIARLLSVDIKDLIEVDFGTSRQVL